MSAGQKYLGEFVSQSMYKGIKNRAILHQDHRPRAKLQAMLLTELRQCSSTTTSTIFVVNKKQQILPVY